MARPGFALARQIGDKLTLRDASDLLAKLYAQRGDFAAAYRYRGLAVAYKDTLTGEATQRKTAALRYGYELDKKQSQIALLTKSRELQRPAERPPAPAALPAAGRPGGGGRGGGPVLAQRPCCGSAPTAASARRMRK